LGVGVHPIKGKKISLLNRQPMMTSQRSVASRTPTKQQFERQFMAPARVGDENKLSAALKTAHATQIKT